MILNTSKNIITMNNYSKMNPFYAGQLAQANFEAAITSMQPDYNIVSTFASDFAIADAFGADAVEDTYERSMASFSEDVFMLTEMSLVLNWAIWRYFGICQNNKHACDCERERELSIMYDKLWKKLDNYMMSHFTGDDLQFYLSVTD